MFFSVVLALPVFVGSVGKWTLEQVAIFCMSPSSVPSANIVADVTVFFTNCSAIVFGT